MKIQRKNLYLKNFLKFSKLPLDHSICGMNQLMYKFLKILSYYKSYLTTYTHLASLDVSRRLKNSLKYFSPNDVYPSRLIVRGQTSDLKYCVAYT